MQDLIALINGRDMFSKYKKTNKQKLRMDSAAIAIKSKVWILNETEYLGLWIFNAYKLYCKFIQ